MDRFRIYVCVVLLLVALAFGYFLPKYMSGCVCTSKARMEGKTVVITGANTGIGKETALDLAKRGARVIMACRDMKKGAAALKEIIKEAGNKDVVLKMLDLASLKSIRDFAKDVLKSEERLDVLINNAGVAFLPELLRTEDGFEMMMGVNHLGHFLLTNLLQGLLKKSAPSRIVVVSSSAHLLSIYTGGFAFDNINGESGYNFLVTYSQSKLANILFTRALARRLEGSGVTVNSLHPGVLYTELQRHAGVLNTLFRFCAGFLKSPRQGAQTTIHVAVSEKVEGLSGLYFTECEPTEPSKEAQDDKVAETLWEVSARLVGLDNTVDGQ